MDNVAQHAGNLPAGSLPAGRARPDCAAASLISCPECALPADVTDRFMLASTDGPVAHIALACVAGHYFRMAVDRLPADAQAELGTRHRGRW